MNRTIPLARPTYFGEEADAVKEVLESGWWKQGPKVLEFEKEFAGYVGSKHAVAVSSCTAALHLAIEISAERRVYVPDFTWPAAANSATVLRKGLELVDVDEDTFNMNELVVDSGCVVPTDIFGNPCDIGLIEAPFIVEDAACAIGSYMNGRHVGARASCACFSFDPRKLLATGEGGMLTTDNEEIAEKARLLRWHGFQGDRFVDYGYNFKLTDIQAAIGLVQLKHMDEMLNRRASQVHRYRKLIGDYDLPVTPQRTLSGATPNHQAFVVKLPYRALAEGPVNRVVSSRMREHGVETQIGTYCLHCQPSFGWDLENCTLGYGRGQLRVSELLYTITLALPAYHSMTEPDQVYVIETLKKTLEELPPDARTGGR